MAHTQRRYWNFKDNDATKDINRWLLSILPKGLYFGFDFTPSDSDMTFVLDQETTGQTETDQDNNITGKIGKFITPHGVVVHEEGDIDLSITAADATLERIDIVVATLDYIETVGGANVIYSIILGTAGSGVPPALPFPEKQIILGQITVPPAITTADAVTYERPPYLFLGNRPDNFAYMDRNNVWSYVQSFEMMNYNGWGVATSSGTTIVPPEKGNLFATTVTGTMDGITGRPEGTPIKIYFAFACTLSTSGNLKLPGNVSWKVASGDVIEFVYYGSNGGWTMSVPGISELARKSQPNKFTATNTFGLGTATINTSDIMLANDGNIFHIGTVASLLINTLGTLPDETLITVRFNNRVKIAHNVTPTTGYSTIKCPDDIPLIIQPGEYVNFIMRGGNWEVYGGRYIYKRDTFKKTVIVN